jgi:hypothetical protein
MLLWISQNFFLDAGRADGEQPGGLPKHPGEGRGDFPSGRLTSTAWAGWWHDDTAAG